MVGVLISMKVRVLRNSLRGAAAASFAIGGFVGLAAAVACALITAGHPGDITVGTDIASAFFAVWTLGWLFGPVLTGGGDETLRPENFALLPIPPRRLAVGLLGASLGGLSPVVSLVAFSGLLVVAIPAGFATAVVALVAVVAQLALVVLLSRVVIAGIGALLGSRRGKDLGVLLGALVGLGYLPARAAFEQLGPIVVGQTSPAFTTVLRDLPSGWGPNAVAAAAGHDWLPATGWLLALAALDTAAPHGLVAVAGTPPDRGRVDGRSEPDRAPGGPCSTPEPAARHPARRGDRQGAHDVVALRPAQHAAAQLDPHRPAAARRSRSRRAAGAAGCRSRRCGS